jgi:hypothetical protein
LLRINSNMEMMSLGSVSFENVNSSIKHTFVF